MANAQHTRSAHGTADEVNLEFDAHRTGADEGHHPPILVLSRDANLVETVKGYAAHEEGVFKDIAEARSRLMAAKSPEETIQAALRRLYRSTGRGEIVEFQPRISVR